MSTYKILPLQLHDTADAAIAWFKTNWGISSACIEIEPEIHPDVNLRPTFTAKTRDGHILCVEVSETIYKNSLDSFILDCQKKGLPVKLVVAVPRNTNDPEFSKKLRQAKRAGAGLLEVDSTSGNLVEKPLALSLTSVRPVELEVFPRRYREALQLAEQTFRDGEPAKACASIYDELEGVFRRFAKKCASSGIWTCPPKMKTETVSWAALVENVRANIDRNQKLAKCVPDALLSRIHGVTTYRNDTGHNPKDLKERKKRDAALRTRFESAVDLFREFVDATRPLKI